jgi:hypothetical protein
MKSVAAGVMALHMNGLYAAAYSDAEVSANIFVQHQENEEIKQWSFDCK